MSSASCAFMASGFSQMMILPARAAFQRDGVVVLFGVQMSTRRYRCG